jgi:hypothetical protein
MDLVCALILIIYIFLIIRIEQVVIAYEYNANHLSYLIEKTIVIILLFATQIYYSIQLFNNTNAQINSYSNTTVENSTLVD